jgi:hypothetical protein
MRVKKRRLKMKLNHIDHAAFAAAWNAGISSRKIGEAIGIDRTTVCVYARLLELPLRKKGGTPKIPDDEFTRLWNSGVSGPMIAKTAGYKSASSVYHRARAMGLPLRYRNGGADAAA